MIRHIRLAALAALIAISACVTAAPANTEHGRFKVGVGNLVTVLNLAGVNDTTKHATAWIPMQPGVGLTLVADGTLAGSWKIETTTNPLAQTATAPADDPADITSGFSPTISTVVGDGGATAKQFVQIAGVQSGYLRVSFTPTSGTGGIRVHMGY